VSLPHETLIELMSLADGELEGEAKARAEKLVAESDEARAALDGFRAPHAGLWLAETLDRRATAAGADGIAGAVMGRLATEITTREGSGQVGGQVLRLAGSRKRGQVGRGLLVASVLGVTALAAGVALFIRSSARPESEQMPVASVGMPSVDMQKPASEQQQQPSGQGVEVDEVDSPSRGISVFEIPLTPLAGAAANVNAARSGSSVVVWIDDEAAK
jgi:hypothetical protein